MDVRVEDGGCLRVPLPRRRGGGGRDCVEEHEDGVQEMKKLCGNGKEERVERVKRTDGRIGKKEFFMRALSLPSFSLKSCYVS